MSEPKVPPGASPADVDAPVARDEETGEQRYPEQQGGVDEAGFDEDAAEQEGRKN